MLSSYHPFTCLLVAIKAFFIIISILSTQSFFFLFYFFVTFANNHRKLGLHHALVALAWSEESVLLSDSVKKRGPKASCAV